MTTNRNNTNNINNYSHTSNYIFGSNILGVMTHFNIQSCNLPGISFNHINVNKNSVGGYIMGDTLVFSNLELTVIVDENLEVWKDIVNKILRMREPKNSTAEEIKTDSWLEIHDDNSKVVVKLDFHDSTIESISDLEYNTTDEDTELTFNLTLKYDYYTIS